MGKLQLNRGVRVLFKTKSPPPHRAGTVVEVIEGGAAVQWDDGETSAHPDAELVLKGRGRQVGDGAKVPKDPAKDVSLDRRVSEVVHREMAKLNLSQRELAKRVGMSRRTIQRIVATNGHWQRIETLEKIAVVLGISPARFWDVGITAR